MLQPDSGSLAQAAGLDSPPAPRLGACRTVTQVMATWTTDSQDRAGTHRLGNRLPPGPWPGRLGLLPPAQAVLGPCTPRRGHRHQEITRSCLGHVAKPRSHSQARLSGQSCTLSQADPLPASWRSNTLRGARAGSVHRPHRVVLASAQSGPDASVTPGSLQPVTPGPLPLAPVLAGSHSGAAQVLLPLLFPHSLTLPGCSPRQQDQDPPFTAGEYSIQGGPPPLASSAGGHLDFYFIFVPEVEPGVLHH